MAYNVENLTKLKHLKELAQRVSEDFATKEELAAAGGEANVITAVKVNGAVQSVTDKAVDIAVPTKVSALTNDSGFQTGAEVSAAIQAAVSAAGHAVFEKADAVPEAAAAQENVLYLVMNNKTKHYDIYAKVGEDVVLLDDTTVDLSGYVEKEEGKGLSANDYTAGEKTKLGGIAEGATKVEAGTTPGSVKINGTETALVAIAADGEVTEMLAEVFGAAS